MNISKALKEKNRLAGKIKDLQNKITSSNIYTSIGAPHYDAAKLFDQYLDKITELETLKCGIAKANAGIQDKLVRMSELKSFAAFLTGFSSKTDLSDRTITKQTYSGEPAQSYIQYSAISRAECDKMLEDAQTEINKLQDEIDTYNALTKVILEEPQPF
jgi:hypothetical protein